MIDHQILGYSIELFFHVFFPTAIKWDHHADFTGTKNGETWPSKHGDWVNQPIREIGESLHRKQTLGLNALDPFVFFGDLFKGIIFLMDGTTWLRYYQISRCPVDSSWFYGSQTWFVLYVYIARFWDTGDGLRSIFDLQGLSVRCPKDPSCLTQ